MPIDFSTLNKASTTATTTGTTSSPAKAAADDPGSQDRFLKLLITQIQNQDPQIGRAHV